MKEREIREKDVVREDVLVMKHSRKWVAARNKVSWSYLH